MAPYLWSRSPPLRGRQTVLSPNDTRRVSLQTIFETPAQLSIYHAHDVKRRQRCLILRGYIIMQILLKKNSKKNVYFEHISEYCSPLRE